MEKNKLYEFQSKKSTNVSDGEGTHTFLLKTDIIDSQQQKNLKDNFHNCSRVDNTFTDFSHIKYDTTEYYFNNPGYSNDSEDNPFYLKHASDSNKNLSDSLPNVSVDLNADANDGGVVCPNYWQQQMDYNFPNLDGSQSYMMNESLIIHELGIDDSPSNNEKEITCIEDIATLTECKPVNYYHKPFSTNSTGKSDIQNAFDILYQDYASFTPTETIPESQSCLIDSSAHFFTHKFDMSNNGSCYQSNDYINILPNSLGHWTKVSKSNNHPMKNGHSDDGIKKLSSHFSTLLLDSIESNVSSSSALGNDMNTSNAVATEYMHSNQSFKSFDLMNIVSRAKSYDITALNALICIFNESHEQNPSLDDALNSLFDNESSDSEFYGCTKLPFMSENLLSSIISYAVRTENERILSMFIAYAVTNEAPLSNELVSGSLNIFLKSMKYSDAYNLLYYMYNKFNTLDYLLKVDNFSGLFKMCKQVTSNAIFTLELYQFLLIYSCESEIYHDLVDSIDNLIEDDSEIVPFLKASSIPRLIRLFIERGDWSKISSYLRIFLSKSDHAVSDLIGIINYILETNSAQIQSIMRQIFESNSSNLAILLYTFTFLHMHSKSNIIYMIYADAIDKQLQNIPVDLKSVLSTLSIPVFSFDFKPQYIISLLNSVTRIYKSSYFISQSSFDAQFNLHSSEKFVLKDLNSSGNDEVDTKEPVHSQSQIMGDFTPGSDEITSMRSFIFSENFLSLVLPKLSNDDTFCLLQLSIASFDIMSINVISSSVLMTDNRSLVIVAMANNALVNYGYIEMSKSLLKRAEKLFSGIMSKLCNFDSSPSDPGAEDKNFNLEDKDGLNLSTCGHLIPMATYDMPCISAVSSILSSSIDVFSHSDSEYLLSFLSNIYNHSFIISIVLKKFETAHQFLSYILKNKLRVNTPLLSAMCHVLSNVVSLEQLQHLLVLSDLLQYHMTSNLYSSILDACIRVHSPRHLLDSVNKYKKLGFHPDLQTFGLLIKFFSSSDEFIECFHLWNEITARYGYELNEVTYGCMFDALVSNNLLDEALNLLKDMKKNSKIRPNTIIYSTLIKGFGQTKQLNKALNIYLTMLDEGVVPNTITYNSIIDACARVGDMNKAASLLEDMLNNNIEPDLITFSTVIKGYCVQSNMDRSLQLLRAMSERGIKPDGILYNSLLDGCVKSGRPWLCQKLWDEMQENGIAPSNFTLTILIKMYGRSGQLDKAFQLMEELPSKYNFQINTHVYTCLMSACIANGKYKMSLDVFNCMYRNGIASDSKTYETIIYGALKGRLLYQVIDILKTAYSPSGNGGSNARVNSKSPLKIESRILKLFAQKVEASGDPLLLHQTQMLAEMLKKHNVILPIRPNLQNVSTPQKNQLKKRSGYKFDRNDSFLPSNIADSVCNDFGNNPSGSVASFKNGGYGSYYNSNYSKGESISSGCFREGINSNRGAVSNGCLREFKNEGIGTCKGDNILIKGETYMRDNLKSDSRYFQKSSHPLPGRTTLRGVKWDRGIGANRNNAAYSFNSSPNISQDASSNLISRGNSTLGERDSQLYIKNQEHHPQPIQFNMGSVSCINRKGILKF